MTPYHIPRSRGFFAPASPPRCVFGIVRRHVSPAGNGALSRGALRFDSNQTWNTVSREGRAGGHTAWSMKGEGGCICNSIEIGCCVSREKTRVAVAAASRCEGSRTSDFSAMSFAATLCFCRYLTYLKKLRSPVAQKNGERAIANSRGRQHI